MSPQELHLIQEKEIQTFHCGTNYVNYFTCIFNNFIEEKQFFAYN